MAGVQKKKSNLLEDAASVLQQSITSTRPMADKFGLGKTLQPGPFTVSQVDIGGNNVKSNDPFPNFTAGVPRATPPGATPPVGAEGMHKLEKGDSIEQSRGTQPQLHMGKGDNTDPTKPPYPDYYSFANRISNVHAYVKPGQGNISPPWANESIDILADKLMSEMHGKFHSDGKKEHKEMHDEKVKGIFGKLKGKFKKEDASELTENDVYLMLNEIYGINETPIDTREELQNIVNNILSGISEDYSTDVNAIFEGENVSDEFKGKAATIFEAVVKTQVNNVAQKLAEYTHSNINEAVEQIKVGLTDKIDEYLNYMVEEWINENEIAIEQGLKTEIVDDFISGLRNLFIENHINVPEEKVDLVDELSNRVSELEGLLNKEMQKNVQFKEEINTFNKMEVINEACVGLTETQKVKIITLSENVSFGDKKTFVEKVKVLRENYFPQNKIVKPGLDSLNNDTLLIENTEITTSDPQIKAIYDSISRIAKI